MIMLYHILGTLVFTAALPVLPLVWLMSEKRRANLLQRLGLLTGFRPREEGRLRIWVHALSVGEVTSALPLVQGLRERRPGADIVFTAATRTGYQTACRELKSPGKGTGLADQVGYFPFDLWFAVRRVLSQIDPDLVILVETDLWPGMISTAASRNIPVVLANARLSSRAHRGYRRFGILARPMFAALSHTLAQTDLDARRFREVGVRLDRISVAGNIKFDRPPPEMGGPETAAARRDLGLAPGQRAFVAGSTHGGEEDQVLEMYTGLRSVDDTLKLIVAPRNPDRSTGLVRDFRKDGWRVACFSDPQADKAAADILVIDTLGVLLTAYGAGSIAFVGGSLADQGGHNPLEPAMYGKPVFFGPHMEDFHEVARMLVRAGGAVQVQDGRDFLDQVEGLMRNRDLLARMGAAAQTVFFNNSGAVERTIGMMEDRGLV